MKKVAYSYYVHRSNINELLQAVDATDARFITVCMHIMQNIPMQYAVVKYNKDTGNVSFIESHDWDTANEPTVGTSYCFKRVQGTYKAVGGGSRIYHNKWQFVAPDYHGFDIQKAKQRTELLESFEDIRNSKNKIGNRTFWETLLRKHNIPL